jgi:hypothetical protein
MKTVMLTLALTISALGGAMFAQVPPAATPQQTIDALRSSLGDQIAALGHCKADLGDVQNAMLKGQLQAPADVIAQARPQIEAEVLGKIKGEIEKTFPGKTLDASGKVIDVPKPTEKSGRGGGGR